MTTPFQLAATNTEHAIMGIDPGVLGGLAFLYRDGTVVAMDLPTAGGELDIDGLAATVRSYAPRAAVIERANAFPGQGVSSVFKFGKAYGSLLAMTVCLGIPYHLVQSGRWKNHFKLDSDKAKSRALAIRLWPGTGLFTLKKSHGRAEAALIARYGVETIAGLRA